MTATVEETGVDESVLDALDFDTALPCDGKRRNCDKTAEYVWTMMCCGTKKFYCEDCTFHNLELVKINAKRAIHCLYCKHACLMQDFKFSVKKLRR